MNLNINNWKDFRLSSIFTIHNGKGITKEEIADNPGTFTVVQSGEENNGVLGKIDLDYCKSMNYTLSEKPCLTVARSGSAGYVSYQPAGCVVGDSAKILLLNHDKTSNSQYLFMKTVLSANKFKYAYGRKVTKENYLNDTVKLPIRHNPDGTAFIDETHTYSEDGYVPDWEFMNRYIHSLHDKPITTKNQPGHVPALHVQQWKTFKVEDIFEVRYGVNLELNACVETDKNDPDSVNFVARTAENNGISSRVKVIDHVPPQKSGLISVAGGGSVLSTFYQDEPFYSGRDLYTLDAKENISPASKIFIITVIEQNKYKYSYGRQANKTLPTLIIRLPILYNADGTPYIDDARSYSAEGYVPDWKFMEQYIRALPYGDRIE